MNWHNIAIEEAKKSKAQKRKVGAVLVLNRNTYLTGHNHHPDDFPCETELGETVKTVIHAEMAVLHKFYANWELSDKDVQGLTMYVTHKPCDNCATAIRNAGITKVIVVETFMKFDDGKLRYDLIPPGVLKQIAKYYTEAGDNPTHIATMVDELVPHEAITAMEDVLRYGAKKYKPNNWKEVDDPQRYVAALYRHLEARRAGELLDQESGLQHLHHAMTNIAFLIYLDKGNPKLNADFNERTINCV